MLKRKQLTHVNKSQFYFMLCKSLNIAAINFGSVHIRTLKTNNNKVSVIQRHSSAERQSSTL